jgi:hypothetical protein
MSEQICIKIYTATFNCIKEEWKVNNNSTTSCGSEPPTNTWELISDCDAIYKKLCPNNECQYVIPPSPPTFQPSDCCNKCVWFFTKEYNCVTQTWECKTVSKLCSGGGGNGQWVINGCIATTSIALDILCQSTSDCPDPTCEQAPPGPFTKPNELCCDDDSDGINTITQCQQCTGDCNFLGCSVIGFNGSIGWNTQESMVNIDLVEVQCDIDGTGGPPQVFTGTELIGFPVYFNCGSFFFGGLLQNWTYTSNSGGRTYNVKIIDPRQILEQATLIIDTYAGPPVRTLNYFNVYGFYEEQVYLNKDCSKFGDANVTERGMPYNNIMEALRSMNPVVCTPTGANLTIDWSTFNIPVPEYFRIAGPSITILQLIADICDEAGYDFFVTLEPGDIIRIYPVSMKQYDPIEDNLFFGFDNVIDFSYGKELRITKTRNLIFGEQQHYLDIIYGDSTFNPTDEAKAQYIFDGVRGIKIPTEPIDSSDPDNPGNFEFYFGEDSSTKQPITPFKRENGQFWINIDIRKLNVTLIVPFPVDKMDICEYDIRSAMHGFDAFWAWALHARTPSVLGKAIQQNWNVSYDPKSVLERVEKSAVTLRNALADLAAMPNADRAKANLHSYPPVLEEIKKVHEWIAELGRTYYGRQYLIKLKEKVCIRPHPENYGEKMYTDTPTNDGGWVEPGIPVLGLPDPELEMFRTDDSRVGPLALFHVSGECYAYSGDGGGEYAYTLGSGVEVLPSGSGDDKPSKIICRAPDGSTGCSDNPYHPDYISGCVCEEEE